MGLYAYANYSDVETCVLVRLGVQRECPAMRSAGDSEGDAMLLHSILDDMINESVVMVTPTEIAQITGFDVVEVRRYFHGWSGHRAFSGEMLMSAPDLRKLFLERGIVSTGTLKAENDRLDASADIYPLAVAQ